jgi:hypothetical protein
MRIVFEMGSNRVGSILGGISAMDRNRVVRVVVGIPELVGYRVVV